MSADWTTRQVRAAILNAKVAEYERWELLASCNACDRHARSLMTVALGMGTICDGVRRLRCQACRQPPSNVWISYAGEGWRQRTIKLWGDGAYS